MSTQLYSFEGGSNGTAIAASGAPTGTGDSSITASTGTGATLAFSSTQAAHGTLSGAVATSTTSALAYVAMSMTAASEWWGRAYIYRTAQPSGSTQNILRLLSGTTSVGTIRWTTAGKLELDSDAGGSRTTLTQTLGLNQWWRVEFHALLSTSGSGSWTIQAYSADSTTLTDSLTLSSLTSPAATANTFRAGLVVALASQTTFYLDDIGVSSDGAYLGPWSSPGGSTVTAAAALSAGSALSCAVPTPVLNGVAVLNTASTLTTAGSVPALNAALSTASTLTAAAARTTTAAAGLSAGSSLLASGGASTLAASAALSSVATLACSASASSPSGISVVRPSWTSAVTGGNSSISTVTVDTSGAAVADTMLVILGIGDSQTSAASIPSGWTLVAEQDESKSHLVVASKLKGSTSETSAVFSWPSAAKAQAVCQAYFGGAGVEGAVTDQHIASTVTHTTGSSTPGSVDRWAIAAFLSRGTISAEQWNVGTGLTKRVDTCTTSSAFVSLCVADSGGQVTATSHTYTAQTVAQSDGVTQLADNHGADALFYLLTIPATPVTPAGLGTGSSLSVSAAATARPAPALAASSALTVGASNTAFAAASLTERNILDVGSTVYPNLTAGSTLTASAVVTTFPSAALSAGSASTSSGVRGVLGTAALTSGSTLTTTNPQVGTRIIGVSNGDQLAAALLDARAGDIINLAPNTTYAGSTLVNYFPPNDAIGVSFVIANAHGTPTHPIIIQGDRTAILDGNGYGGRYCMYVALCSYVQLRGFTAQNGAKGVISDQSSHCRYENLFVGYTATEGLHLRKASCYNVIDNCEIAFTGVTQPGFGEGVYIGSANGQNWQKNGSPSFAAQPGNPDASDHNILQNSYLHDNGAEGIDCKEGTTNNIVRYNRFDGIGESGYGPYDPSGPVNSNDSSIDAKGNCWEYYGNTFTVSGSYGAYAAGIQQHLAITGWGIGNQFWGNTFTFPDLNLSGYPHGVNGYAIEITQGVAPVSSTNTQTGAISGLTNQGPYDNVVYIFTAATLTADAYVDTPGVATPNPMSSFSYMAVAALVTPVVQPVTVNPVVVSDSGRTFQARYYTDPTLILVAPMDLSPAGSITRTRTVTTTASVSGNPSRPMVLSRHGSRARWVTDPALILAAPTDVTPPSSATAGITRTRTTVGTAGGSASASITRTRSTTGSMSGLLAMVQPIVVSDPGALYYRRIDPALILMAPVDVTPGAGSGSISRTRTTTATATSTVPSPTQVQPAVVQEAASRAVSVRSRTLEPSRLLFAQVDPSTVPTTASATPIRVRTVTGTASAPITVQPARPMVIGHRGQSRARYTPDPVILSAPIDITSGAWASVVRVRTVTAAASIGTTITRVRSATGTAGASASASITRTRTVSAVASASNSVVLGQTPPLVFTDAAVHTALTWVRPADNVLVLVAPVDTSAPSFAATITRARSTTAAASTSTSGSANVTRTRTVAGFILGAPVPVQVQPLVVQDGASRAVLLRSRTLEPVRILWAQVDSATALTTASASITRVRTTAGAAGLGASASVTRVRSVSGIAVPPGTVSASVTRVRSVSGTAARADFTAASAARTRTVAAVVARTDTTSGPITRTRTVTAAAVTGSIGLLVRSRSVSAVVSAANTVTASAARTRSVSAVVLRADTAVATSVRVRTAAGSASRTDRGSAGVTHVRTVISGATTVGSVSVVVGRTRASVGVATVVSPAGAQVVRVRTCIGGVRGLGPKTSRTWTST